MTTYGPTAPVPVFQHEAEFTQLLDLYRERSPKNVLEVGTYYGGTLYHWLQNAQPGTTVVSVDSYAVGVDNRALYESWCPDGVKVVPIEGNSHEPDTAAAANFHGPFDWVWIDAGHYYWEVKQDWAMYRPLCRPGGVVCFHDILPPSNEHPEIEVSILWQEIKGEHKTVEIIEDEGATWGGIGVVYL